MTDKQPFDRSLLKKGAIVHFRCGGSDEVEGINDSGRLKLKSGFSSFWGEAGNFYTDLEHPIDIIAITPAKERERLKGFVGISVSDDGQVFKMGFNSCVHDYDAILDLSDCYHTDWSPWCVGDGK